MLLLIEQTRSTNNATEGGGGGVLCKPVMLWMEAFIKDVSFLIE